MPPIDVSVIITCFDERPEWIREAVESARNQRGCNVEVIVVDDGSSHGDLVAAVDALPEDVTVVRRRNGGPGAARNTGMSVARGRYLLALDGDDTLDCRAVAAMASVLDARPDAAVARIRMIRVDEQGRLHPEPPDHLTELSVRELVLANGIPGPSLFRAYDWRRRRGYDESLAEIGFEDYEWWVRLLSDGAVAVPVPEATVHCRERNNSRCDRLREHEDSMNRTRRAMLKNSPQIAESALNSLWYVVDRQREALTRAARYSGPAGFSATQQRRSPG